MARYSNGFHLTFSTCWLFIFFERVKPARFCQLGSLSKWSMKDRFIHRWACRPSSLLTPSLYLAMAGGVRTMGDLVSKKTIYREKLWRWAWDKRWPEIAKYRSSEAVTFFQCFTGREGAVSLDTQSGKSRRSLYLHVNVANSAASCWGLWYEMLTI